MQNSEKKDTSAIFSGKSTAAVIEQILAYVLTKSQAKEAAKSLTESFGGFSSILETPVSETAQVQGMNRKAAELLHDMQQAAQYYLEDKASLVRRIFDTESAVAVLRPKFFGKKREVVALLLLDGRGRILYNGIVNEGSVSEVPIYIRRVVELCLRHDAYTAMIAHNHPSGNPLPSKNDINATRDLEFALNGIDVELTDHIIFAEEDYTSMKSSEWLEQIKKEVQHYKNALRRETMEQEEALFANPKK